MKNIRKFYWEDSKAGYIPRVEFNKEEEGNPWK